MEDKMLNRATADDFINVFGLVEAIELSNIDDASQHDILKERIDFGLQLAYDEIMSYDSLAKFMGKFAIRTRLKSLMLDIARYKLDTADRRKDVIEAYTSAKEFLKFCVEQKDGNVTATDEEILDLELSLTGNSYKHPQFINGRRAFTDASLKKYRNQKLY